MTLEPIAYAHNGYMQKFGIPRQSGCAASVLTRIDFTKDFQNPDMLRGIEEFSHLWLLWGFSENHGWSPTVRPPRLGGNKRLGVFATRSPFRPNPIGLSAVRLERIEQGSLIVSGADLMNGTPIYDIKPYIAYTDSHPDAALGFTQQNQDYRLEVIIPDNLKRLIPLAILPDLYNILREDPRPQYHDDDEREYGITYYTYNIRFRVLNSQKKLILTDFAESIPQK